MRTAGVFWDDIRWAFLTATIANAWRGKNQPSRPLKKFQLTQLSERPQTPAEMLSEMAKAEPRQ